MGLVALAAHAGIVGGIAVIVGLVLWSGPNVLRLIAGLIHLFTRNESRAGRALAVLTALRPGPTTAPDNGEPRSAEQDRGS